MRKTITTCGQKVDYNKAPQHEATCKDCAREGKRKWDAIMGETDKSKSVALNTVVRPFKP